MTKVSVLRERLLQAPEFRAEYEALKWRGNRLVRISTPKAPGLFQAAPRAPGDAQN
ncbi:MAG TPA: hypothetical protein VD978_06185 [Azospirillum sp.]|nr:hypothetical protein [Azospirillum sp.]